MGHLGRKILRSGKASRKTAVFPGQPFFYGQTTFNRVIKTIFTICLNFVTIGLEFITGLYYSKLLLCL